MSTKEIKIMLSKAPDHPFEHKVWANQMLRIQLSIYVDEGAICEQCGYTYKSVDDFIRCDPKRGYGQPDRMTFVCSSCWSEYVKSHNTNPQKSSEQS